MDIEILPGILLRVLVGSAEICKAFAAKEGHARRESRVSLSFQTNCISFFIQLMGFNLEKRMYFVTIKVCSRPQFSKFRKYFLFYDSANSLCHFSNITTQSLYSGDQLIKFVFPVHSQFRQKFDVVAQSGEVSFDYFFLLT